MRLKAVVLSSALAAALGVCVTWAIGGLAGKPTLLLSGKGGTECVMLVGEEDIMAAITNAFEDLHYREMMLLPAVGEDWLVKGWHPTNGFLLRPTLKPISQISTIGLFGKRTLPYEAYFHITVKPVGTNRTIVMVTTICSDVLDGLALNLGGLGRGRVKVPPVLREEKSVLDAIRASVELAQRSRAPAARRR